jgi:hypothetical protein
MTTTTKCAEVGEVHSRLLKCTLELDNSRTWWTHPVVENDVTAAFEDAWFGARSLPRVRELVANLRARFDAYPQALRVLREWRHMEPATRALVCHWHVQLTDPLYRAFTGEFLVERHESSHPDVTRERVTRWVDDHGPGRWTLKTRIQFASQLLVTARAAGMVKGIKGTRQLVFPRVSDDALTYLLYLLRGVEFAGTLLNNPYLASVGLMPGLAEDRARALSALQYKRQGDILDFGWAYRDLGAWADATRDPPATSAHARTA